MYEVKMYEVQDIPLELLKDSPYKQREDFGDVESLAKSIEERGLQHPISVLKVENYYIIVHGHRRTRAFRFLKRDTIPAYIRKESTREDLMIDLAIENLQRKDLLPIEKGNTLKQLLCQLPIIKTIDEVLALINQVKKYEQVKKTGKFTEENIIWAKNILKIVGMSTTAANNYVRLLLLPSNIQKNIVSGNKDMPKGTIGVKSAYELTRINDAGTQQQLSEQIIKDNLKHKDLKYIVDKIIEGDESLSRKVNTGSASNRTDIEVKIGEIIEELFTLSTKVDNFRPNLPIICKGVEKVRFMASLNKMKKVCMDMVKNINSIIVDNLKQEDLFQYVNADLEVTVSSSNKYSIPVKIVETLGLNQGDVLLLKIEGIKKSVQNR